MPQPSRRSIAFALHLSSLSVACGSSPSPSPPPAPSTSPQAVPSASQTATAELAASATPAPSAVQAAAISAPIPSGPPPECRGGKLELEAVLERCRTDEKDTGLPDAVAVELEGPAEVKAGEKASYALQYVNRSREPVSMTLGITCTSHLYAVDGTRQHVVRYETTDGTETLNSCNAKPKTVAIVLEPGGMLVEPLAWRARGELYRDGKPIKREPLAAGKYTLRAFTWLSRFEPGKPQKQSGISVAVTAERPVLVR
jgi:hypothetical protein